MLTVNVKTPKIILYFLRWNRKRSISAAALELLVIILQILSTTTNQWRRFYKWEIRVSFYLGPNESFYMGELMEGTYCSRIFGDCDKRRCVLQSPNYPGLYPRNLTCYYAIRQHSIPFGHQALISITQPYSRLVSIKTDRTGREGVADPKPVERKVK